MNNKQWEEEELRDFIETNLDAEAHGKWHRAPDFSVIQDVAELLAPRFVKLLSQREAEIRKEAIDDYLKSEEGLVYQDYQALKKQAENDVRKETIEAVMPEEKDKFCFEADKYDAGWNDCRQSIIDSAKEKFNINLDLYCIEDSKDIDEEMTLGSMDRF